MYGSQAIDLFESFNDEVDIVRIQFDAVSTPAGFLGGEQRCAAAGKRIHHNAASLRAVKKGVADKREWFWCRMIGKRGVSVLSKTVHAGILPNIRSASSKASKLDVVDVFGATVLVDKNELVSGAI